MIRSFIKAKDSILPPITDAQGHPISIFKLNQHENTYYFDVETSASPTIYISNIPLTMYH